MKNIKALKEERGSLLDELAGLQNVIEREARSMSEKETSRLSEIEARLSAIASEVEKLEKLQTLAAQAATQAGMGLGQLGTSQQASDLQRLQAQEQFGAMGQAERQRALDLAYQDFIAQRQDPYKQLGFLSDILRGSANLAATGGKAVYEQPPSLLSQLGGAGLAAAGAYRLMS